MSMRKFICDPNLGGCGKKTKEPRGMSGFRGYAGGSVPRDIEIEYVDLCEKCGNKRLKEQKLLMRITAAATANILTEEELKTFGRWPKLSPSEKRIFIEEFQRKEKDAKKAGIKLGGDNPNV